MPIPRAARASESQRNLRNQRAAFASGPPIRFTAFRVRCGAGSGVESGEDGGIRDLGLGDSGATWLVQPVRTRVPRTLQTE